MKPPVKVAPPPAFDMKAYLRFLKIESCNMRAKALYFAHAADELETTIKMLTPPRRRDAK